MRQQERPEQSRIGDRDDIEKSDKVVTANGEVRTKEEATVYVKELDLYVTVMLLEDTPTVLSLGKLCEDHRENYHWTSGQKPQLIKKGRRMKPKNQIQMTTTRKHEETRRMICQNGYRSSGTVWEMKVFQNTETLPVLLMNYLQSREQKWYRVSTAFLLTSLKIFPGIILRQHRTDRKLFGIPERAVHRIKEGTSAVLLQSGLDEKWWADSMEC